jgi:hypothetical protein
MEASWTIANLLTGGRAVRVDATVEPGIYSLDAVRKNLCRPSRRIHCVEGTKRPWYLLPCSAAEPTPGLGTNDCFLSCYGNWPKVGLDQCQDSRAKSRTEARQGREQRLPG